METSFLCKSIFVSGECRSTSAHQTLAAGTKLGHYAVVSSFGPQAPSAMLWVDRSGNESRLSLSRASYRGLRSDRDSMPSASPCGSCDEFSKPFYGLPSSVDLTQVSHDCRWPARGGFQGSYIEVKWRRDLQLGPAGTPTRPLTPPTTRR